MSGQAARLRGGGTLSRKIGSQEDKRTSYNNILSPRERVRERGRNFGFTLAEVFHPAEQSRKNAFTLAEVLITLGIIGIIAALTMPSLIANYQKKVLVTQLKKQVNVISNNLNRVMVDEGVDVLSLTSIISEQVGDDLVYINNSAYKKYFNYASPLSSSKTAELLADAVEEDFNAIIQTNDGAVYTFYFEGLVLDVNGDKGPNKIGRDRFTLATYKNGLMHHKEIVDSYKDAGYTCEDAIKDSETDEDNSDAAYWLYGGALCYARIVKDGWQMKY